MHIARTLNISWERSWVRVCVHMCEIEGEKDWQRGRKYEEKKRFCWQRGILVNGVILRLFRSDKTNMKQTLYTRWGRGSVLCVCARCVRSICASFFIHHFILVSAFLPHSAFSSCCSQICLFLLKRTVSNVLPFFRCKFIKFDTSSRTHDALCSKCFKRDRRQLIKLHSTRGVS